MRFFDYKDPDCAKKIREATKDGLKFVFDCVSEGSSMEICANAMSTSGGGKSNALLPVEFPRSDVETGFMFTIGYSVNGEAFTFFGNKVSAKPEDFEFGKKWWGLSEELFKEGKIRAPAVNVREGGLRGVFDGFEDMKNGRISRQKLVYRVEDTP